MTETETPKTKKPRGAPKSFAEKLKTMADAKRKQVQSLEARALAAQAEADRFYGLHGTASEELKALEAAIGAAS